MKTAAEFFRALCSYHPEHDAEDRAALEARDRENQVAALRMAAQALEQRFSDWADDDHDGTPVDEIGPSLLREMADRIERGETPKP